jgi:hypothetical protein
MLVPILPFSRCLPLFAFARRRSFPMVQPFLSMPRLYLSTENAWLTFTEFRAPSLLPSTRSTSNTYDTTIGSPRATKNFLSIGCSAPHPCRITSNEKLGNANHALHEPDASGSCNYDAYPDRESAAFAPHHRSPAHGPAPAFRRRSCSGRSAMLRAFLKSTNNR